MICYALGVCFNAKDINWCIPGVVNNSNYLFAQNINQWKRGISTFCNTLELGICERFKQGPNHFYALRAKKGFFIVGCDSELNRVQIHWLSYHLLDKKIALNDIAANLSKYASDLEVEALKQEVVQLKETMMNNIEKIIDRGEKIEDLLKRTDNLITITFAHHKPVSTQTCTLV